MLFNAINIELKSFFWKVDCFKKRGSTTILVERNFPYQISLNHKIANLKFIKPYQKNQTLLEMKP